MANFNPTEEQCLVRDTMSSFAREVLRPEAHEADEHDRVPDAVVSKGWELGIVQSTIPEAHGGYGETRSAITSALLLEELSYGDLSIALHLVSPRLFTIPLIVAGTPAQQAQWLPRFAADRFTAATAAFVEPTWDFDPTALSVTAKREGNDWVLNGEKCLVPLAATASLILVYASTPTGLGAFIVEKGTAGVTISEREQNMGIRALDTFGVSLKNVKVPADRRLGGETTDLQPLVDASRVASAALATGVARAAFDYARDYAKDRKAFGVAIAQKQAIAFKLADMATEVDAIRLLTWEAAWRIDGGKSATREAYLARQYASERALKIADDAVQVLGGHGYIREHPVERHLRNARGFMTLDGLAIA